MLVDRCHLNFCGFRLNQNLIWCRLPSGIDAFPGAICTAINFRNECRRINSVGKMASIMPELRRKALVNAC
jgi:hypothetical protein